MATGSGKKFVEGLKKSTALSQIDIALDWPKKGVISGTLGIWKCRNKWQSGFRAYVKTLKKRSSGRVRRTKWEAVEEVMQTQLGKRVLPDEWELARVKFGDGVPSGMAGAQSNRAGSQPKHAGRQLVDCVHQIYGLFRDGKDMPELFKQSSLAWQQYAADTDAQYVLWNADQIDSLARLHLPASVLEVYVNARYPIMRADIGRILVLYKYGGLYADLDILPNRERYEQCSFGIARMRARKPAQKWEWEMELLVSTAGNPVLLDWLQHIAVEVGEKSYSQGFYQSARCRYVYQTSGPASMTRFLKHSARGAVRDQMPFFDINRPERSNELSAWAKRSYDAISHFSMSYDTKEDEILVAVSEHLVELPRRRPVERRRQCFKGPVHLARSQIQGVPVQSQETVKEEQGLQTEKSVKKEERDSIVNFERGFEVIGEETRGSGRETLRHEADTPASQAAPKRPCSRNDQVSDAAGARASEKVEATVLALSQRCERAEALNAAWISYMVDHWDRAAWQTVRDEAPEIVQWVLNEARAKEYRFVTI